MDGRKEKSEKLFKEMEKKAKIGGFNIIYHKSEYGEFDAQHTNICVNFKICERYDFGLVAEVGWSSAGTPRPQMEEIEKHIQLVQVAMEMKKIAEEFFKKEDM